MYTHTDTHTHECADDDHSDASMRRIPRPFAQGEKKYNAMCV